MVAGKSCAGRGRGMEWGRGERRLEGVAVRGKGGLWWVGGGSKNSDHLVCLCVSKEIVALTGGFFLPGMKQK